MRPASVVLGASAAAVVLASAPRPPARGGRARVDPRPVPSASPVDTQSNPGARRLAGFTPAELAVTGVLALLGGLVLPPLGLVVVGSPVLRRWRASRRRRRAQRAALADALPEAVDLLLLCAGAGLSLPLAVPLVAERAPDPVGAALRAAEAAVAAGAPRADALVDRLGALGDPAAALAHVLADHLRYGVPLVPGLERAALELRLARRRRAEEEARRLPVRLLAPLLLCVLPAFALLTVVPLLVAALRSLPR